MRRLYSADRQTERKREREKRLAGAWAIKQAPGAINKLVVTILHNFQSAAGPTD